MWVLIFFFFFLTWVFGFLLEAKSCFWVGEGWVDITAFPSFIVVCCDP